MFRSKWFSQQWLSLIFAGCCLLGAAACGYRLGGYSCESFASVQNISVPLFSNRSYLQRTENVFSEALRKQVQAVSCFSLSSRAKADALLKGTILSVETYTVAVDEEFLAVEYGMRVVLSVSLPLN